MSEILLVTLCASICGAEGWQDVEDFGNIKIEYLREYLPYKNGIPANTNAIILKDDLYSLADGKLFLKLNY